MSAPQTQGKQAVAGRLLPVLVNPRAYAGPGSYVGR
jgi:hypothetical protein